MSVDWNSNTAVRTIWQEARGEPVDGQRAVAHVIVNRLADGRWGHTLAEVCLSRDQFSAWGRSHDPNFAASCRLADNDRSLEAFGIMLAAAASEPDPTQGATHYYAKTIAPPAWVKGDPSEGIPPAIFCGQFGHHLFYRNVK